MGVINDRIKNRRTDLGLTLLEVADALGVKEATAQRYESGAIKSIGHDTIIKFMYYEKVNFRVVIGGGNGCHGKL